MFIAFALALSVSAAAPGDATDHNQAAPAAPAPAMQAKVQDADANKMICHNEQTTGTRLGGVHVCMTKAQWEERASANGARLGDIQNRSAQFSLGH